MQPRFLGNGYVSHGQLPSRISLCAFKRSCETLRRNLEALVYAESLVIALLAQARNSQLRGHCSPKREIEKPEFRVAENCGRHAVDINRDRPLLYREIFQIG